MHIWVIGEWILLLAAILIFVFNPLRFRFGDFLVIPICVLFAIWNGVGVYMYAITLWKSPSCVPQGLAGGLFLLMLGIFLGLVGIIVVICV